MSKRLTFRSHVSIQVVVAMLLAVASLSAADYSHKVWRTEDGLPQNRVQAITQTQDGYLWVGTSEGLARFDGSRFTVFDRSNTPALGDNSILCLVAAPDGTCGSEPKAAESCIMVTARSRHSAKRKG